MTLASPHDLVKSLKIEELTFHKIHADHPKILISVEETEV